MVQRIREQDKTVLHKCTLCYTETRTLRKEGRQSIPKHDNSSVVNIATSICLQHLNADPYILIRNNKVCLHCCSSTLELLLHDNNRGVSQKVLQIAMLRKQLLFSSRWSCTCFLCLKNESRKRKLVLKLLFLPALQFNQQNVQFVSSYWAGFCLVCSK